MSFDYRALEERLGYSFQSPELLLNALTHTSYAHENKVEHNERLEFLGDAILGAVISRILFERYPKADEGTLSSYRDYLVCESTLSRIARRLSLGELLRLGKGEIKHGGWDKSSILADATEAIVAAVYLDAKEGGEAVVFGLLCRLF